MVGDELRDGVGCWARGRRLALSSAVGLKKTPTATLSPFARGYLSLCRFFTAAVTSAVWCVPALRVPLVHSLINHFRQKPPKSDLLLT